jgi:hypothetical protein
MATIMEMFDLIDKANADELDMIVNAAKARRQFLTSTNVGFMKVGTKVSFRNLSPKYLNGLTGTVVAINSTGSRGTVKLDNDSTERLASTNQSRFYVESGIPYTMVGVPLKACDIVNEA